jgi:hypothetical protein
VSAALLSGLVSLLGSPPAHAALLTVGTSNHEFGGLVCADVKNASSTAGTAVQAYDCFGDLNEQFEFNGFTIYALGGTRCLDVSGTKVVSNTCTGAATQTWYYYNGEITNANSGLCLDAMSLANGTQLVTNGCSGATSQNWQIK